MKPRPPSFTRTDTPFPYTTLFRSQPKGRALAELPTVFVLSGPNLNLLGTREPEIYGHDTLNDIHARLEAQAAALGLRLECRQTNHEGVLIDWLHEAYVAGAKAVLLNAGGYTPTSIAIPDAKKSLKVPGNKVHLPDPTPSQASRTTETRVGK